MEEVYEYVNVVIGHLKRNKKMNMNDFNNRIPMTRGVIFSDMHLLVLISCRQERTTAKSLMPLLWINIQNSLKSSTMTL